MNRIRHKRISWALAGICSVVVLSSGCLSYRTGGLPDTELNRQDFTSQSKPIAYIEVSCQSRGLNEDTLGKNVAAAQEFRGILAGVFSENQPFKSYTFSTRRETNVNMRIVSALKSETSGSVVSMLFTIGTFAIIPATQTMTHQLTTQVYDSRGKKMGEYEVEDSMRVWVQLLLLPLGSWKAPEKTEKQLMDNLVRTTLSRMKTDGLLSVSNWGRN